MAFNIESVPNRTGKPAILPSKAWREGKRVRKRTTANLSRMSPEIIDGFRGVLKGGTVVPELSGGMKITRALRHGHAAAALGTARAVGLERILHRKPRIRRNRRTHHRTGLKARNRKEALARDRRQQPLRHARLANPARPSSCQATWQCFVRTWAGAAAGWPRCEPWPEVLPGSSN